MYFTAKIEPFPFILLWHWRENKYGHSNLPSRDIIFYLQEFIFFSIPEKKESQLQVLLRDPSSHGINGYDLIKL